MSAPLIIETYRDTDVSTGALCLDLYQGWGTLEVRGADVTIPGKDGQTPMTRRKHMRRIPVRAVIRGVGATLEDRQDSFLAARATLDALMDPSLLPGTVVTETHTIEARCSNEVSGPIRASMTFQEATFELVCISDPPDWEPIGSS